VLRDAEQLRRGDVVAIDQRESFSVDFEHCGLDEVGGELDDVRALT
jgi:hypothetical protein